MSHHRRAGFISLRPRPGLWALGLIAFACVPAAHAQRAVAPAPAMDAVFRAFSTYHVVLLGEIHWSVSQHDFIQRLLRDPRFPDAVRDVAVEFGNALYQPLIDRYVAGEDVPADSLQLVWRNTVVSLAWDRPMYSDVFRTIREINRALPPARRIRVVALDPPIEWRTFTDGNQLPRRWGYRDPVWFEIFEREVLAKRRKALVIAGALHILRHDPPDFTSKPLDRAGFGDALGQRDANRVYRIYPSLGTGELGQAVREWPTETLADVRGTTLGTRSSAMLWASANVTMLRTVNGKVEPYTLERDDFPPLESLVDAVLFYGPNADKAPWPVAPFRDAAYVDELRRRNALLLPVFGQDQREFIDSIAAAAALKLWSGLTPGPFASIGYATSETDGVVAHVWYPATERGAQMSLRRYLGRDTANYIAPFAGSGFARPALDSLLDAHMLARADAPAVADSFPMILIAHGNGQSVADQAVLCEYLASHGYVVVSTPSPMIERPMTDVSQTAAFAERHADALERVARVGRRVARVRGARYAVVGHSFGARPALLLAMRHREVAAIVSLDGGIGTATATAEFRAAPSFVATAPIPPVLHVFERLDSFMTPDFTLLQSLRAESLALHATTQMRHAHFSTIGFLSAADDRIARLTRAGPALAREQREVARAIVSAIDSRLK